MLRRSVVAVVTVLCLASPAAAIGKRRAVRHPATPALVPQSAVLTPSKDNTLYQTVSGSLSNGSGIHIFSGATSRGDLRRALLRFDLASRIPPGSRVTAVSLSLRVSQTIGGAIPMTLHRVIADWGEGASDAGDARDGGGAPSSPGDATWIHRFFPSTFWAAAGGDFTAAADATAQVSSGLATWSSSEALVARVQEWVDQPETNFGWIIIGAESTDSSAKRFESREIPNETLRPRLVVEYLASGAELEVSEASATGEH